DQVLELPADPRLRPGRPVRPADDRDSRRAELRARPILRPPAGQRTQAMEASPLLATLGRSASSVMCAPNGIRTRAAALKGRCPRPLDDRGVCAVTDPRYAPAHTTGEACRPRTPGSSRAPLL